MLFRKKEYMKASLNDVKFFEGDNPYSLVGGLEEEEVKLSNGQDIQLFFEYHRISERDCGVVKEVVTGSCYERFFGVKLNPGYLKCDDYNMVIPADINQVLSTSSKEVKQYLKELKKNGLYKEYVQKVSNVYQKAAIVKSENNAKTM